MVWVPSARVLFGGCAVKSGDSNLGNLADAIRAPGRTRSIASWSVTATNDPDAIAQRVVTLLEKTEAGRRPVRLLGAGVY